MPDTEPEKNVQAIEQKKTLNAKEKEFFVNNLNSLLGGNRKVASRPLTVGSTTNALALCSANEALPLTIMKKIIDKAMRPEIRDENGRLLGKTGHGLTKAQLVHALDELKNPVMIFRGTHGNSLLAITSVKDDKDRNIVVSIDLNRHEAFGYTNSITSLYGRDNLGNYIEENINNGNLLAVNIEKADEMLHSIGKSYPKENTFISFDNSIAYSMENVNTLSEKNCRRKNLWHKLTTSF